MLRLKNLQRNVPLAPYTTYKIGGPADYFFVATSKKDLAEAVRQAREDRIPHFILGAGANMLVGDKGFRGLVIQNRADNVRLEENLLRAESGAMIADLIDLSVAAGLSGLEHFAGIPSTVGGALWQNLHFLSPDRQSTMFIESVLRSASVLELDGTEQTVDASFFRFGYDDSILHHKSILVLEATFELAKENSEVLRKRIAANLAWRNEKQPQLHEFPSCGSVFKKIPDGVGAGRLIEKVGLKGRQIGGARISEKHANYIVNTGGATASDVMALIKLAREEVQKDSGYVLEPEITLVGEF